MRWRFGCLSEASRNDHELQEWSRVQSRRIGFERVNLTLFSRVSSLE